MTSCSRHNCKLVEDFIIPSLDKGTFGDLLKWEDETRGLFKIKWTHKAKSTWDERELEVFLAWDRLKGRVKPEPSEPIVRRGRTPHGSTYDKYLVNSKQRLRAALRNIKIVKEELPTSGYKRYTIKNLAVARSEVRTIHPAISNVTVTVKKETICENARTEGEGDRPRRRNKLEPLSSVSDEEAKDPTFEINPRRQNSRSRKTTKISIPVQVKKEPCFASSPLPTAPSTSTTTESTAVESFKTETSPALNPPKIKIPRELACLFGQLNWNLKGTKRRTQVSRDTAESFARLFEKEVVDGNGVKTCQKRSLEEIVANSVQIKTEVMDWDTEEMNNPSLSRTSDTKTVHKELSTADYSSVPLAASNEESIHLVLRKNLEDGKLNFEDIPLTLVENPCYYCSVANFYTMKALDGESLLEMNRSTYSYMESSNLTRILTAVKSKFPN